MAAECGSVLPHMHKAHKCSIVQDFCSAASMTTVSGPSLMNYLHHAWSVKYNHLILGLRDYAKDAMSSRLCLSCDSRKFLLQ